MASFLISCWNRRQAYLVRLLGLVTLCLFLSLISYNREDPSFNRAADDVPTNILGQLGAYIADPIVQFTGIGAFLVVALLAGWCIRSWRWKYQQPFALLKLCLYPLAIICFCGVLAAKQPGESWPFYVGYGGVIGDVLLARVAPLIGFYPYTVIMPLVTLTVIGLMLGVSRSDVWGWCVAVLNWSSKLSSVVALSNSWFKSRVTPKVKTETFEDDPFIEPAVDNVTEAKVAVSDNVVEFDEKKQTAPKPKPRQVSLKLSPNEFELPDTELLEKGNPKKKNTYTQSSLQQNAKMLQNVLQDFGISGEIIKVRPGPVVTLYELEPSPGTKSSRVIGLAEDIARSMSAVSARIAVIPGKNVLGIELPNSNREMVMFRELLETEEYLDGRIKLPIALGKDIGGAPVMADLARMPHLLIAGTTGSGKSVAVNSMILSFLYRLSPEECKFIMIDPKMLELSSYEGIPHLLSPVVTEPGKAVVALNWAVKEMENRYRLMSALGVRNIASYNKRMEEALRNGEVLERTIQTGFDPETGEPTYEVSPIEMEKLPYIVIIVDEMADLMLTAGKEIEASVQRLAQMARAAGLHLIMATQRPSVDVITGIIKANFPTRISFQVTSRIDSRTILGEMGAEQLLGMGDMLYMAGGGRLTRVHGPFVDDAEVAKVVEHLKIQGMPDYIQEVTEGGDDDGAFGGTVKNSGDELYDKAVAIVLRDKKASTSYIQRQLKIGYNRAANIIEKMEAEGVVSSANHAGKREILVGS